MTAQIVVTLDGPAGVGKSTLAKRVAEALGLAYLDTGAMFRTIAFILGDMAENELKTALQGLRFSLSGTGNASVLACNGQPAGPTIRTEAVGLLAARLAALPVVREALKNAQRNLGREFPLVAEGRDMGSVIFPGAPFKFFLNANPEVRALRRYRQLMESGTPQDLASLTEQIRQRDEMDKNRPIAPLKPADDAVIIDTSAMNIDRVFQTIMDRISIQRA
jgi:cytidylate kinase